ncbi:PfkB family carbohydrate kinase, partial [Pseudomonas viridiflava]|uniref:PfkB family carbohydrate kinase n=1 Tax=Pseudomonas viridiflava TaxID=33069 RepID=UPI001F1309F6
VSVARGGQGTLCAGGAGVGRIRGGRVQAVDRTGAGDTFVGGFAAALARGQSESQAIRFGQAAAALSVTRAGAQPSIPTFEEVQGFNPR